MPHNRSAYAKQRRYLNQQVNQLAYRDKCKQESINLINKNDAKQLLTDRFDNYFEVLTKAFQRGEVLSDAYGDGTLQ